MSIFENSKSSTKTWESKKISIVYRNLDFQSVCKKQKYQNNASCVRLHFNMKGAYNIYFAQLDSDYYVSGQYNNIAFLNGYEVEVENKTKQIQVLGIQFDTDTFVEIAQNSNDPLKKLVDKIQDNKNAILSNTWRPNSFHIQQVLNEILHSRYTSGLQDIFLLSKSIELLVHQAELYEKEPCKSFLKSSADRKKIHEAMEILSLRTTNPPTIRELSKLIGLNEYKLKKGFKEIFGLTVFGYIQKTRMDLAKKLLLDTDKSAKEIAYLAGFSSPPHFTKAFKSEFGVTPSQVREPGKSIIIPH